MGGVFLSLVLLSKQAYVQSGLVFLFSCFVFYYSYKCAVAMPSRAPPFPLSSCPVWVVCPPHDPICPCPRRLLKQHVGAFAMRAPLSAIQAAPHASVDPAAYVPPPLRRGAVGYYPEHSLVWEKYGIGRWTL